ncbi:hypothetical protein HMPREF1316_0836 [Olsenella profusa F0195]|uniref:Uncharacterized protein n=1 Tax=Olsenella profusa F0195 TaxID=1125712 RepID=U2USB1_9ACTN|nr:hypothetical protein HMPREF1316_0836 [Olsenella profusa F0195]
MSTRTQRGLGHRGKAPFVTAPHATPTVRVSALPDALAPTATTTATLSLGVRSRVARKRYRCTVTPHRFFWRRHPAVRSEEGSWLQALER